MRLPEQKIVALLFYFSLAYEGFINGAEIRHNDFIDFAYTNLQKKNEFHTLLNNESNLKRQISLGIMFLVKNNNVKR